MRPYTTYQLLLHVERPVQVTVGKLGTYRFARGYYLYTGSAKRNLRARLLRHLSRHKKLRWHIDYLLHAPAVRIVDICLSMQPECMLNQHTSGEISVRHFGSSDCRSGCGSHLKYAGLTPDRVWSDSDREGRRSRHHDRVRPSPP